MHSIDEMHILFKEEDAQLTLHPCFNKLYKMMFYLAKDTTTEKDVVIPLFSELEHSNGRGKHKQNRYYRPKRLYDQ